MHEPLALQLLNKRPPSPRNASEIRKRGAFAHRERGRMKLNELHIANDSASPISHRHPIARSDIRIGRVLIELARAAGRKDYSAGIKGTNFVRYGLDVSHAYPAPVFDD